MLLFGVYLLLFFRFALLFSWFSPADFLSHHTLCDDMDFTCFLSYFSTDTHCVDLNCISVRVSFVVYFGRAYNVRRPHVFVCMDLLLW